MEFWLQVERADGLPLNDNQIFQLPVNPPDYEKIVSVGSSSFDVEDLGEINFIGKKKLATIPIASFFPAQHYDFCVCTPKDNPYDYIWCLENWMHWQTVIRLIITDTNINMLCSIESLKYGEKAGSRDVEFTLDLKEYRKLPEWKPI